MNKYDEALNTLILIQDSKVKSITKLKNDKEELQQTMAIKEETIVKNKQKYAELDKIKDILTFYSFKVSKKNLLIRCVYLFFMLLTTELFALIINLIGLLILHQFLWFEFAIAPFVIILSEVFKTLKNRNILKNYKYEDVKKELIDLINNNKELALALEKDKENMEDINERINIEIDKKLEIEAKIKQVYNQKYKALTSLINVTYDKELSKIYDQDEVIKRVLQKEDTCE